MNVLCLRNAQRTRPINLRLFRKIISFMLKKVLQEPRFELGIRLVAEDEMAKINETFLQHAGSTDVVTFDHRETMAGICPSESPLTDRAVGPTAAVRPHILQGEIFISVDDAVAQAKQFRTRWQSELVRYVVHGILHLRGFDDLNPAARRKMKREENRVLQLLDHQFRFAELQRKPRIKHG